MISGSVCGHGIITKTGSAPTQRFSVWETPSYLFDHAVNQIPAHEWISQSDCLEGPITVGRGSRASRSIAGIPCRR